jgi:hypothetical protein
MCLVHICLSSRLPLGLVFLHLIGFVFVHRCYHCSFYHHIRFRMPFAGVPLARRNSSPSEASSRVLTIVVTPGVCTLFALLLLCEFTVALLASLLLPCEFTVALRVYCCSASLLLLCEFTVALRVYCCPASLLLPCEFTVALRVYCCSASLLLLCEFTVALRVHCCSASLLLLLESSAALLLCEFTVALRVYCCSASLLLLCEFVALRVFSSTAPSLRGCSCRIFIFLRFSPRPRSSMHWFAFARLLDDHSHLEGPLRVSSFLLVTLRGEASQLLMYTRCDFNSGVPHRRSRVGGLLHFGDKAFCIHPPTHVKGGPTSGRISQVRSLGHGPTLHFRRWFALLSICPLMALSSYGQGAR